MQRKHVSYNIYIFNSLNLYILGSQGMKCITRLDIFLYFSAFYITILHYLKNQKLSQKFVNTVPLLGFLIVFKLSEACYFKCKILKYNLDNKYRITPRTETDLNLRLVKSNSYLPTKMYWIIIVIFRSIATKIFFNPFMTEADIIQKPVH